MKRFYIAAVAGLCAVAPIGAQDGTLAPTAPVVPAPVLQNGSPVVPAGGPWGTGGPRLLSRSTWSPFRSPVVAGDSGVTGYAPAPAAACGPTGCGTNGCGPAHGGTSWGRLKAWLCFSPSKTDLPKFRPTPYIGSLQGSFGCASGAGCGAGGSGGNYPSAPPVAPIPPLQMPAPVAPSAPGAGLMPPRGTQGAATPTAWRPAPAPTDFGTKGTQGPVVNTGYRTVPK